MMTHSPQLRRANHPNIHHAPSILNHCNNPNRPLGSLLFLTRTEVFYARDEPFDVIGSGGFR
jgi:hypothetical protein